MTFTLEGVDYSAHDPGTPSAAALKAAGKHFVCCYVVGEGDWRVNTPAEISALIDGGIEIISNYEGTADRFLDGYAAGAHDAAFAQANVIRLGLPAAMPIYFSADFDATPGQQAAIDDYLRGVASVIGLARTGVYGGFYVVKRCSENGTAKWFWQTSAWSGGQVFDGAHLYQYAYNNWIQGVNVDLTQALQEHYGQHSDFIAPPPPPPPPQYVNPEPVPGTVQDQIYHGTPMFAFARTMAAVRDGVLCRVAGTPWARQTRAPLTKGTKIHTAYLYRSATDGEMYVIGTGGSRVLLSDLEPVVETAPASTPTTTTTPASVPEAPVTSETPKPEPAAAAVTAG